LPGRDGLPGSKGSIGLPGLPGKEILFQIINKKIKFDN
jgi:hypothetical protein